MDLCKKGKKIVDCIYFYTMLGAACGTLGSILTAFSATKALQEVNYARRFIETSVQAIAENPQGNIPIFTGLDKRFKKAAMRDGIFLWIGVLFLSLGFVLQAMSILSQKS